MELALSVVALLGAALALALVLNLRGQVAQIPRVDPAEMAASLERLRQELSELRHDVEHEQRELDELKTVTQLPLAPPLPRARSAGLTDLREQLRAAHLESEPDTEE